MVVEGGDPYITPLYTISTVLVLAGRTTGHASFSRGTAGKYARHVYYTYNSQVYTPVVYKDVKRRGCTQAKIPRPSPQRGAAAK